VGIGERILGLLKTKGITQAEIAQQLGVNQGTVSHWISGDTEPSPKKLPKLAEALEVSVGYLLMGEDVAPPPDHLPSNGLYIGRNTLSFNIIESKVAGTASDENKEKINQLAATECFRNSRVFDMDMGGLLVFSKTGQVIIYTKETNETVMVDSIDGINKITLSVYAGASNINIYTNVFEHSHIKMMIAHKTFDTEYNSKEMKNYFDDIENTLEILREQAKPKPACASLA